jgi:DNA-binding transcriptional ArsR family regulator
MTNTEEEGERLDFLKDFREVVVDEEEEINFSEAERLWLQEDREDYEWITEMDKEILRVLMLSHLTLTPAVIADNIDRSRAGVSHRLNALSAGGLVEKEGRGKYKISKLGAGYLMQGLPP